jgi:hypothetical protein
MAGTAGDSKEPCRLTVQYRPFRLIVDLTVILLGSSAPSHRRTAAPSTRSRDWRPEPSIRNTHPQLGKRHPDILLKPLCELSSDPRCQRATCTCLCHWVLTMAKRRWVRPIPRPSLRGPLPSRSPGLARGSCGRNMSFRSSPRDLEGEAKSERRRTKSQWRTAKGSPTPAGRWRVRRA